jgi:hypothetical protein
VVMESKLRLEQSFHRITRLSIVSSAEAGGYVQSHQSRIYLLLSLLHLVPWRPDSYEPLWPS